MRRFFLSLFVLLWASCAQAQTTTFDSSDCNNTITITGSGLILTASSAATYKGCRANVAKWSGKKCFQATIGAAINQISIGIGSRPSINGAWSTSPGNNAGVDLYSSAIVSSAAGKVFWNNTGNAAGETLVNGNTAMVCVDLDNSPTQIWATADAAGVTGFGGGPLWNGDVTSSPTLPGTGAPVTSNTGRKIFIPGYGLHPIAVLRQSDKLTYNFATAGVGSYPTNFTAWEDNSDGSGTAPNPGPTNPVTVNVANAPGRAQSTAYAVGQRVVAGPGWQSSAYVNGANLYLWAVDVGGGGTSSGSGDGPQTCATPAGSGGIPTAAWAGATRVSDGSVSWVCLTQVDYVTLTGAFGDTATNWATVTAYFNNAWVINAGKIYRMNAAETVSPFTCLSSATPGGPTGTTLNSNITDGTCIWLYQGTLTYSSQSKRWPHQIYNQGTTGGLSGGEIQHNWNTTYNVWYGGSSAQVYQPGQNGELNPILMWYHSDFGPGDTNPYCYRGSVGAFSSFLAIPALSASVSCNGKLSPFYATFTAAPGDSFQDILTPGIGPLRVDSTKGVTLYETTAYSLPSGAYGNTSGAPVAFSDSSVKVNRLQIQSVNGVAVAADGLPGPGGQHANNILFDSNIIDSGAGPFALSCDAACAVSNNIIIARTTTAGSACIRLKYPAPVYNNTCIGNNATNGTFLQNFNKSGGMFVSTGVLFPPPFKNNIFVGFPNPWAYDSAWASTDGANNATDVASGFSGGTFTPSIGANLTSADLPGVGSTCGPPGNSSSCYSLTASNQFSNATIGANLDLRIGSTSAGIYGAGATFSFAVTGDLFGPSLSPGDDILNTSRPQSSRYDIGAEEFMPGSSGGSFRMLLGVGR